MTKEIDVSTETARTYVYSDGSAYAIESPRKVYVTETGSHRVVDADGWTHRPEPGWIAIKWLPQTDAPAFVA